MTRWEWGLVTAMALGAPAHAQQVHADGFEACDPTDTRDGDRLTGCEEIALQLDPFDPDTDDDGIRDGDEVLGTVDGLYLPALGLNPRRKEILLEHDWVNDQQNCGGHSHKPGQAGLQQITALFAAAPATNPDGSTGITVIHDIGQGGLLAGGSLISLPNGTIQGGVSSEDYIARRSVNFDPVRVGFFHYVLHAHRFASAPQSTGNAEILGDDMIVSMQCEMQTDGGAWARNTILHELGHNLGLRHGGDTHCNLKPNYNSVMNYNHQRVGVDTTCDTLGDGVMDYSAGTRLTLREDELDELQGVCGSPAIDWNLDSFLETSISLDLNPYNQESSDCGGLLTPLTDHDDWAHISLRGLANAPENGEHVAETVDCLEIQ